MHVLSCCLEHELSTLDAFATRCISDVGTGGPIFGRSVNPIRTGGGQIIPTF